MYADTKNATTLMVERISLRENSMATGADRFYKVRTAGFTAVSVFCPLN